MRKSRIKDFVRLPTAQMKGQEIVQTLPAQFSKPFPTILSVKSFSNHVEIWFAMQNMTANRWTNRRHMQETGC